MIKSDRKWKQFISFDDLSPAEQEASSVKAGFFLRFKKKAYHVDSFSVDASFGDKWDCKMTCDDVVVLVKLSDDASKYKIGILEEDLPEESDKVTKAVRSPMQADSYALNA